MNGRGSTTGLGAAHSRTPSAGAGSGGLRRRYHFHLPGVFYILVTLFLAIGALNSQNNLLFASLGLAIGGLLVSGVLSGGSLMGIRIERSVPDRVHLGEPLRIAYQIRNRNLLLPAFGLTVIELDAQPHIQQPRAFAPHVPARGLAEAVATVETRRRGSMMLGSLRAWTTFPFGLAKKSVTIHQCSPVVVHPVALPVRRGILDRLTVRSMTGVGAAVQAGRGEEIYGLREYTEGDHPRQIAWRRSARTGQLLVRQNTTPSPRKLWVVLRLPAGGDAGGGAVERETAIALASALVRACAAEGAAVGLAVPGYGIAMQPRISSRAVRAMMDQLAQLEVGASRSEAQFPLAAVRSSANVVVDAGDLDRAFGTSRTVRIGVDDMDRLLLPGEALERAKVLLSMSAPQAQSDRIQPRGWLSRLWRGGEP